MFRADKQFQEYQLDFGVKILFDAQSRILEYGNQLFDIKFIHSYQQFQHIRTLQILQFNISAVDKPNIQTEIRKFLKINA